MSSKPFTARFPEDLVERLTRRSESSRLSRARLAEQYIEEGLRMDAHPGIVFRDGPAGRRAGLAGWMDVWEMIAIVQAQDGPPEAAIEAAAQWLDTSVVTVRTAVQYYGEFRDEIDEWIRLNDEASAEAEAAWKKAVGALT